MSSSKRLPGIYLCLSRCILCEIWTSPNMITCNCSFIHAILFRRFVGPGEVLNAGWKATWLPTVQITASLALHVNQNRARNLRSPHRNRLDKRNLVQSTVRFVAARIENNMLVAGGWLYASDICGSSCELGLTFNPSNVVEYFYLRPASIANHETHILSQPCRTSQTWFNSKRSAAAIPLLLKIIRSLLSS
jgi:hypothetical protein